MLRSINLPQGLLQANMVERIQQTQQQHPDMQQRYFESALAQERKRAEETVNDFHKMENKLISKEDRDKQEKKRSLHRSGEGDASEEGVGDGDGEELGLTVDVKV